MPAPYTTVARAAAGREPVADYEVLTPERVRLRYDLAGIGSRSAAALLDLAIELAIAIALFVVFAVLEGLGLFGAARGVTGLGVGIWIVVILGMFLLLWGYYLLFELAWSGQTPGKRVLGIRVIRENGYPIRAWDAVVRNIVRIIDAPPFGEVLGLLVMLLNDRSKRLGDFAAGTIVIREGKLRSLSALASDSVAPALPGEAAAARLPALSAQDATLVRDFLARREAMNAEARMSLARRLAAHLRRSYGLQIQPSADDEAFLESLTGT